MALVRVEGLEPPSFWHLDLNQACLPIPPHPPKGPAGPESACFYIIRGMVFKRILPEKRVFSGRPPRPPPSLPGAVAACQRTSLLRRQATNSLFVNVAMHKRIAAMQQHRFQTGSAAPIFVSSSRSKKSNQHEKQETSTKMNLIRNYRNWRRYRETVSELSRLTNREL